MPPTDARREAALARLQPHVERARAFRGWDLSDVPPRLLDAAPPWDYAALARERLSQTQSALDMGTGGGETLTGLLEGPERARPARIVATEEWHVNAPLARDRLTPLGVHVLRCHSPRLPFADAAFDLVLNRHEELDPAEVARVLRPGGVVITQQVHGAEWQEVRRHIPRMVDFGWLERAYLDGFTSAGLRVSYDEHHARVAYRTLGDVVYLLALMPWCVADFDLAHDLDAILDLEATCGTDGGIVLTESRFLIIATKEARPHNGDP